jgi:hypothetical protein
LEQKAAEIENLREGTGMPLKNVERRFKVWIEGIHWISRPISVKCRIHVHNELLHVLEQEFD